MDLQKAITFVGLNGDMIERARNSFILWGEAPSEEVLKEVGKLQKPGGGFAYWCPQVSNICDTAYILQWLDDLGSHRTETAERACRFLLERQCADGGWDEVEDIARYSSPEWMIPGRLATRTWLTGFCSHMLIRFGYAEAPGTRCPTDFLLSHCDESGRIRGYLRATWISLPMLAFHPGPQSEPYRSALSVVEENYSEAWTGAHIAWLLWCLKDAHVPLGHPLVDRAIAHVESKQRSDGSWEPEPGEGEEHAVNATISALRSLHVYGRIERQALSR
ncbi:MAG: prenyltransferase/squalene oxidase repeat-containing protein [Anaerolineae bacterium]|jgi:hypothetical protein